MASIERRARQDAQGNDRTLYMVRWRTRMAASVNGEPHQLSDSYFPPFVTDDNELFWRPTDLGVQGGLLAATGHKQVRWHDTLTARMPRAEEAQRLRMPAGTPLLVHTRIGYDEQDRPVRYMVTRMAADRVEVSYDLEA